MLKISASYPKRPPTASWSNVFLLWLLDVYRGTTAAADEE